MRGLSSEQVDVLWQEEEKRWSNVIRLLEKWHEAPEVLLRPEGIEQWNPRVRASYLESVGRMFASLESWHRGALAARSAQARGEYRRLVAELPEGDEAKAENILRFCAAVSARERDSNTYGNVFRSNTPAFEAAIKVYQAEGNTEAVELLTNPFKVELGTSFFRRDGKTGEILTEQVMDIDHGAAIIGDPENAEVQDLTQMNIALSRGEYMKSDGDNVFGGRAMLTEQFDPFQEGAEIDVDTTSPFSETRTQERVTVVGSNRRALEEKYGDAWMQFAALNRKVFTVDLLRQKDGTVVHKLEYHDVRRNP